jgi:hypothetical protein
LRRQRRNSRCSTASGMGGDRRRGRRGRRGHQTFTRKAHPPKTDYRLGEFEFHVAADAAIVFGFHNLADDFFFGLVVGKKEQLSRSDGGLQTDDGAIGENQDGFGGFGKRLALIAAFDSACTVDANTYLKSNWLGLRQ